MSGSEYRNKLTHLYREARTHTRELKGKYYSSEIVPWDEIAEETFSKCVTKHRSGIISSSDFQVAMDYYCMNVKGFLPLILPLHPIFEEDFFLLLFRRHGHEPVISFLPGYQHIWSGLILNIPKKWFEVDKSKLRMIKTEKRL